MMAPVCMPQQRKAAVMKRTLQLVFCFLSVAPLILTAAVRVHAQAPSEDPIVLEQQIRELAKAGKFDEARPLTGKLIEAVKLRFGSESKEYASALLNVPILALKFPSEADLLTVLRIYENHFGPNDPAIAQILSFLAQTYMLNGRQGGNASKLAEAKPMLDRALAILEKKPGADTAQYADALVVLGEFYRASKQPSEAESQFQRAFSVFERSLGVNRLKAISTLYQLEWLYRDLRRRDDEQRIWRQIAATQETALGPDHDETLSAIENLARALRGRCRDEEAADLERRTFPKTAPKRAAHWERWVEEMDKKWPLGHREVPGKLNEIGGIYVKLERLADARHAYERALAGLEKWKPSRWLPDSKPPEYAAAKAGIAEIDRREDRLAEAENGYRTSIETLDEGNKARYEFNKGPPWPLPVEWLDNLETIYRAQNREADAAAVRERAEKRRAELKNIRGCPN